MIMSNNDSIPETIKLTGRLTKNTSSQKTIKFINNKLKEESQADIIRNSTELYRKFEQGELMNEDRLNNLEKELKNIRGILNKLKIKDISKGKGSNIDSKLINNIDENLENIFE